MRKEQKKLPSVFPSGVYRGDNTTHPGAVISTGKILRLVEQSDARRQEKEGREGKGEEER